MLIKELVILKIPKIKIKKKKTIVAQESGSKKKKKKKGKVKNTVLKVGS